MDIKSLKDKILQLAIQGKLVEQDSNDEPASVLLSRIKEEKEQLIKEKKLTKEKLLQEIMEEEKPFDLPNGWEFTKMGNISKKIHYGYTASAETENTGVKLLRITDIQNNKVNWDTVPFCRIENNKLSLSILDNNDILIARTGGTIGKSFIVKNIECTAVFASYLIRLKPSDNISPDYLKLFLESPLYWIQLQEKSNGTGQPNVNAVSLSNLILPLPPLKEQKRIVAKINELFDIIDELDNNKQDLLQNIADSRIKILQLAIQGKLIEQNEEDEPASVLLERIAEEKEKLIREKKIRKEKPLPEITEEEKPFDLPKGWEWVRLGEIVQLNPRNNIDDSKKASFIPMKLIGDGYSNFHTSEERVWEQIKSGFTHFAEDDLVVAKITPCFENRKSVIVKNLINGIGAGTTELYVLRPYAKLVIPEFLFYLVKSEEFIKGGIETYTGTAGQQRVRKEFVENYLLAIPPLTEQKRIVEKVSMIMEYLDNLQEEILSEPALCDII